MITLWHFLLYIKKKLDFSNRLEVQKRNLIYLFDCKNQEKRSDFEKICIKFMDKMILLNLKLVLSLKNLILEKRSNLNPFLIIPDYNPFRLLILPQLSIQITINKKKLIYFNLCNKIVKNKLSQVIRVKPKK